MPKGYYAATVPVDGSYYDRLELTICMPRGSQDLRHRLMCGIIFVLSSCGVVSSGNLDPQDAMKNNQEKINHVK